jgi:hypothetical protein
MVRITLLNKVMVDVPVPVVITAVKYGLLYNNFVTLENEIIAIGMDDLGWRVISVSDWSYIFTYLSGASVAGGKLKETGLVYWDYPNTGATNDVFFNARGNGLRSELGVFQGLNTDFTAIQLSYNPLLKGTYTVMKNISANVGSTTVSSGKTGTGIRLLREVITEDEMLLPDGIVPITYTGTNGVIYPCTKIGDYIITSCNIFETKYQNGIDIPEVTDNDEWAALTTGALCAYNNDWTNVLI